ncbi:cholinesterase [Amylocarpus encephaloides]|uniref:Cholinesterase n=1 Tax=Amylocarpus encephaloides TaxID=45428 RepID=A0A9P7YI94_9HELO|nr:cholinesterase [Amylocarpus encephaloides]
MPLLRAAQRRVELLVLIVLIAVATSWFFFFRTSEQTILLAMPFSSRPRVTIRQGTIIGSKTVDPTLKFPQALDRFLGVPYAMSTGGNNRFRPAVPVGEGKKEFDARKYGSTCLAMASGGDGEDCLNLNIFRPSKRPEGEKLPVLVYIHGGAFNGGFGHMRVISSLVAWSSRPMIGISFNYRLGALGFLSGKLAAEEGALNLGLKDQSTLLQWVKENIHDFDGNPDDVTIMGSSAGAHSVGHHIFNNPRQSPLFHKAIIESGAATARLVLPYDATIHETQFSEFLSHLDLLDTPPDELFDVLRGLPVDEIGKASLAVYHKYDPQVRWPWQPVIDGEGGFIPIAPIKAWRAGNWHPIPIMTGFNTNEGANFINPGIATSNEFTTFFSNLIPNFSSDDIRALADMYPDPISDPDSPYVETRPGLGAQFFRTEQAYGHFAYINPVRQTTNFSSQKSSVWLYQFAAKVAREGTLHAAHDNFATYNIDIWERSPSLREITGKMHAYWTSFITTGDPNTEPGRWEERLTWPKFVMGSETGDQTQYGEIAVFGQGNDEMTGGAEQGAAVKIVDDGWARDQCMFWDKRTELFES